MRTAARDAMLSAEATPVTKGRIFGFHRALDTTGAFIGPSVALVFLYFYPAHYKTLFLFAFLPGIASVLLTFLVKEVKMVVSEDRQISFFSFLHYCVSFGKAVHLMHRSRKHAVD